MKAARQHYPLKLVGGKLVRVHRLRAEKALGKPLPPKAVVHHHGSNPSDTSAQLVICQNQQYHKFLHQRERVLKAGGDPETHAVCGSCRQLKLKNEMRGRGLGLFPNSGNCLACHSAWERAKRQRSAV